MGGLLFAEAKGRRGGWQERKGEGGIERGGGAGSCNQGVNNNNKKKNQQSSENVNSKGHPGELSDAGPFNIALETTISPLQMERQEKPPAHKESILTFSQGNE